MFKFFTVKEVARMLKLTTSALYYRVRKGLPPKATRVRGKVFFAAADIFDALKRKHLTKEKFKRNNPSARKRRGKRPLTDREIWKLLARRKRGVIRNRMPKIYRDAKREVAERAKVYEERQRLEKQKRMLRRRGANW